MSTISKQSIWAIVLLFALRVPPLFGQTSGGPESFGELMNAHAALVAQQATEEIQAQLVADWAATHEWQNLALPEQAWVYSKLSVADRVDPNRFSVRWTGQITPAADGEYVFSQQFFQQIYTGTLKLWVNEELVLDTSDARTRVGYGPQLVIVDEKRFESAPVRLTAGTATPIRVEFVYRDEFPQLEDIRRQWRFPLARVLWRSGDAAARLIDIDLLTPLQDFGDAGSNGLRAEYFADTEFSQAVGAYLEPGVQHAWNKTTIAPQHKSLQTEILNVVRDQLLEGLGSRVGDELRSWVREGVTLALPGLSAADRINLVADLATNPAALAEVDINTLAAWMPHLSTLPGPVCVDLLVAWSKDRELPPAKIAPNAGYGPGSFAAANYGPYRLTGTWMTWPAWSQAHELIQGHIQRADGSCNLLLAHICSFSCRYNYSPQEIERAFAERLSDNAMSPDTRATWLLARGRAAELYVGGLPDPAQAFPSLTEAALIAEDSALRLRIFQERVARYASLGKLEAAQSLIESENGFGGPAYELAISELESGMGVIRHRMELNGSDVSPTKKAAAKFRMNMIRARMEKAVAEGREDLAAHYRAFLPDEAQADD